LCVFPFASFRLASSIAPVDPIVSERSPLYDVPLSGTVATGAVSASTQTAVSAAIAESVGPAEASAADPSPTSPNRRRAVRREVRSAKARESASNRLLSMMAEPSGSLPICLPVIGEASKGFVRSAMLIDAASIQEARLLSSRLPFPNRSRWPMKFEIETYDGARLKRVA